MTVKTYSAFTQEGASVIKTFYKNFSGATPLPGQVVKGVTSGATGIIQSNQFFPPSTQGLFIYEAIGGTINASPRKLMHGPTIPGIAETLEVFANNGSGNPTGPVLASMTNLQDEGTLIDFNDKIVRFWRDVSSATQRNNMYLKVGNEGVSFAECSGINGFETLKYDNFLPHIANNWNIQEFIYHSQMHV